MDKEKEKREIHLLNPLCRLYEDKLLSEVKKISEKELEEIDTGDLLQIYSLNNVISDICYEEEEVEEKGGPPSRMII